LVVGQVKQDATNGVQNIVTVGGSSNGGSSSGSGSAALSTGAKAGIAIGAIAGVALIASILFFLWRRRRQAFLANNNKTRPRYHQTPSSVGDTTLAADSEFGAVDEQRRHVMGEYFKPGNEFGPPPTVGSPPGAGGEEQFLKSELDATQTSISAFQASRQSNFPTSAARAPHVTATEMHELDAGGDTSFSHHRPQNHRSPVSWGSAVSAVSPMHHNQDEHFQTLAQLHEHPSPDPSLMATSPPLVSPRDRHLSDDSVPPLRIPHERQLSSDEVPRPLRVRHASSDSVPGVPVHEMQ
jgi:LPXTG-motif cell wall-anchored protein